MAANRRQYTAEFKAKVVLQVLSGEKTASDLCRAHKLNSNVLNRWRKEFPSIQSSGLGTQLAKNLAKQLGERFRRYPNQPRGTVCELT
jgi:transposase-like protein